MPLVPQPPLGFQTKKRIFVLRIPLGVPARAWPSTTYCRYQRSAQVARWVLLVMLMLMQEQTSPCELHRCER